MDFDLAPHPLDEEAPGGLVINPHSALGKELRKWEQHRTELVPRGTNPGNPYVYREYPKMLYRAQRLPNGQSGCLAQHPDPYQFERADQFERAVLMVESFNRNCTRIVSDESQERIAIGQGWALDPKAAMAVYEQEQQGSGNAAGEAAHAAQGMTSKARAGLAGAHAATQQPETGRHGGEEGAKAN